MHQRPGLVLLAALVFVLAACGTSRGSPPSSASDDRSPNPPDATVIPSATAAPFPARTADPSDEIVACGTKLKVGLVTETGPIDDHGYNEAAYAGVQAAIAQAPTCFESAYVVSKTPDDYAANVSHFTDDGYDIVIGVGSRTGATVDQDALLADALGDACLLYTSDAADE